ncbi:hypothetical protein, partial [Crocosphaera sp. XPORK-15E]|uniref:hypothetical protein n=1 Tax=Crocosphaera sp. XPORK-15E TaxID=3110247 RepID=UPI002B2190DA
MPTNIFRIIFIFLAGFLGVCLFLIFLKTTDLPQYLDFFGLSLLLIIDSIVFFPLFEFPRKTKYI